MAPRPRRRRERVIRIRDLTREYRMGSEPSLALRGVTLDIHGNEYVAIMGPSGSGKSTMMNVLGCLDTPTGGEYYLSGEEVSRLADDALARVRNRETDSVLRDGQVEFDRVDHEAAA